MFSIEKTTRWIEEGGSTSSFLTIFDIKGVNSKLVYEAIEYLRKISMSFGEFSARLVEPVDKKRHGLHLLLWADIISDLAVDIKLATEGYIDQAMRLLRGTLENLVVALFSAVTWTSEELGIEESVNMFSEIYNSPVYSELREVGPDEIYFRGTFIKDEKDEDSNYRLTELASTMAASIYENEISGDTWIPKDSVPRNEAIEILSEAISRIYAKSHPNLSDNEWNSLKASMLELNYIYNIFLNDRNLSLRSCEGHRKDMRGDFKKSLNGKYEDDIIEGMEFLLSPHEGLESLRCDYCGKEASSVMLKARPNFKLMMKVIWQNAPKQMKDSLNYIIREYFDKKGNFDDFIRFRLYSKLNRFVHSDTREEPEFLEWYTEYYLPILSIGSEVLEHFISASKP